MIDAEKIERWFSSDVLPQGGNEPAMQEIRLAGKSFAKAILANTPKSADQSTAIRQVREAMSTAAQAVVCK